MYYRNTVKSNSDFKYGKGWPAYRNVSVSEMENNMNVQAPAENNEADNMNTRPIYETMPGMNTRPIYETMPDMNTRPLYDTMPGSSTYNPDNLMFANDRMLITQLYTNINKILYPFVVEIVSQFDYVGSPIYNEEGIDRETLAQLISRILDLAQKNIDEVEEIRTEGVPYPMMWDRNMLLKSVAEAVLLSYIFNNRRPRYRALRQNYGY